MILAQIKQALEDIGLTEAEIKVYLALYDLGPSTAGPIIQRTKLYNSIVHTTLGSLAEQGLVSYVQKGHVKHYQPKDPKYILHFLEKKMQNIRNIIPLLESRKTAYDPQSAEIFQGFAGFKVMNYQAIEDAKRGDEFLYFAFYPQRLDEFDYVFDFYREFEKERTRRGIVVKGISPETIRNKYTDRDLTKVLFVNFPTLNGISIINDKVLMHPFDNGEISFLIQSKQIAESFRSHFYSIWNKYKKKNQWL